MASTLSRKQPRRNVTPAVEQDWLESAREARAQTPLSADSTELLRELRVDRAMNR